MKSSGQPSSPQTGSSTPTLKTVVFCKSRLAVFQKKNFKKKESTSYHMISILAAPVSLLCSCQVDAKCVCGYPIYPNESVNHPFGPSFQPSLTTELSLFPHRYIRQQKSAQLGSNSQCILSECHATYYIYIDVMFLLALLFTIAS